MTEEEKLIGGFMSLRQLGYLIAGFCLGGMGAAFPLPVPFRIVIFSLFFTAGAAIAFLQLYNMPADVFLWRLWKWWRSQRQFCLLREG